MIIQYSTPIVTPSNTNQKANSTKHTNAWDKDNKGKKSLQTTGHLARYCTTTPTIIKHVVRGISAKICNLVTYGLAKANLLVD